MPCCDWMGRGQFLGKAGVDCSEACAHIVDLWVLG